MAWLPFQKECVCVREREREKVREREREREREEFVGVSKRISVYERKKIIAYLFL